MVFGVSLVVLSLALYDQLKAGPAPLVQTATAFGVIWATELSEPSLAISTVGYLPGKVPCVLQVLARGVVSIDEEEKLPFAVEFADDVGTLCRHCLL